MSHIRSRNNFRKVFAIIQIMEVEITLVGDINRFEGRQIISRRKKRKISEKCFQYMNTFFDKCWT